MFTQNSFDKKLIVVKLITALVIIAVFSIIIVLQKKIFPELSLLSLGIKTNGEEIAVVDEKSIYFGIPARIKIYLDSNSENEKLKAKKLIEESWNEFERLGSIFNSFDKNSEIGKINNSPNEVIENISNDLFELFAISHDVYSESTGAFDPTVWPLKMLWQKSQENNIIPTQNDIAKTIERVGFEKIILNNDTRSLTRKNSAIQFDFGGIAKGFAIDKVGKLLKNNGVNHAIVQLGGEIWAWGEKSSWRFGIQHPKDKSKIWGAFEGSSTVRMTTSGNYNQPYIIQGKEFYHVFDPKTGMPVSERILSVTLVDLGQKMSSTKLDGLTKSILVLGVEKGLATIEKNGLEALILVEKEDSNSPSGKIIEEIITNNLKNVYFNLSNSI